MTDYGRVPQTVMEIADAIERLIQNEYDRGYNDADEARRSECEVLVDEAHDESRLAGFEEGYDEAKEVFQKEGIEDVKAQGYDLGYRAGQEDGLRVGRGTGQERGYDRGMREGFDQGREQGRLEGRSAEKLDDTVRRSRGEHGC